MFLFVSLWRIWLLPNGISWGTVHLCSTNYLSQFQCIWSKNPWKRSHTVSAGQGLQIVFYKRSVSIQEVQFQFVMTARVSTAKNNTFNYDKRQCAAVSGAVKTKGLLTLSGAKLINAAFRHPFRAEARGIFIHTKHGIAAAIPCLMWM